MNRIDRLLGVLTTVQSKKFVSAEYISHKYQISERTVYRDLKALAEIGVPIHFEAGKGYSILKSFFLPPIALTTEEANALILISSLAEKYADKISKKNISSALTKIKSVLQTADKDKVNSLEEKILIYTFPDNQSPPEHLTLIQRAIVEKIVLKINYIDNANIKSQREIEPIGLTFYSDQWHVVAWCWLRKAYRDFKVKQVLDLEITNEKFRKNLHFTLMDYINSLS